MTYKTIILFLFLPLGPSLGWAGTNVGLLPEEDDTLLLIETERGELEWVKDAIKKLDKDKSKEPTLATPFFKAITVTSNNFTDKLKSEILLWNRISLFILFHCFLFYG